MLHRQYTTADTSAQYCWHITSVHYCYTVSTLLLILYIRGAQIFRKSESRIKIRGPRIVKWSESHKQDQQIWGNSVAPVTWRPGFVHPCITLSVHYCQVRVVNAWSWLLQQPGNVPSYWTEYIRNTISEKYFSNRLMFDEVSFGSGINERWLLCKTREKN